MKLTLARWEVMMLDLIKIGHTLKAYRLKHELSQEALALKLFVSHQAISRWETGKSIPSLDTLVALSELYQASLDELLCFNTTYENDVDLLFINHSSMHIINKVIDGSIKPLTLDDIIHKLSKEERFYALNKAIPTCNKQTLITLLPRLSYAERRFMIDRIIQRDCTLLNTIYPLLNRFERNYIKEKNHENN